MRKKIYICDICDLSFKVDPKGHRSYVGLEIHLKYEDDLDFKHRVKMDICPYCLNEIRSRSRIRDTKKGE